MKNAFQLFNEQFDIRANADAELAKARVRYEVCVLGDATGEAMLRDYMHAQLDIILDSMHTQSICVKELGEKRGRL